MKTKWRTKWEDWKCLGWRYYNGERMKIWVHEDINYRAVEYIIPCVVSGKGEKEIS